MALLKNLAKSGILRLMKLIETHSDYYVARNNKYRPFVNPIIGIRASQPCEIDPKEVWVHGLNKIHFGTTQLLSRQIHEGNIDGAAAELGVFRGFHTSVIDYFFPDRKLYLFDTFEGFDQRDLKADEELGYDITRYPDFSDTDIERALAMTSHKGNVVIRKGWFPESAVGLEAERFCFVSLDADLYRPIYSALHWFYPRLVNGGYIMVDDFNWDVYLGVRKAVQDFSREVAVSCVPIPSSTGGVVIGKPLISEPREAGRNHETQEMTPKCPGNEPGTLA